MSQRLRLQFFLAGNFYGGPNRVVRELAGELARRGHDVSVVVPWVAHWTYHRLVTGGRLPFVQRWRFLLTYLAKMILKELIYNRGRWLGAGDSAVRVRRCLLAPSRQRDPKADWYFFSNNWYQAYEWDGFDGWGDRVVQIAHHYEPQDDARVGKLMHDAYALPFARLTPSTSSAEDLARHGVKTDGISFWGVDPAVFHPPPIAPGKTILLYWGLEPRKGAEDGLKAVQEIQRRWPDARVHILCADSRAPVPSEYPCFRALSEGDMAEVLGSHGIFIYPSLMEGFGFPPLEAMACGCAVVATRVGAIPDYAEHKKNAYLAEPGDWRSLVSGVAWLLEDEERRLNLGREAVRAAARFTWRKTAEGIETFLLERKHGH